MFLRGDRFTIAMTLLLGVIVVVLFVELIDKRTPRHWPSGREAAVSETFHVPLIEEDVPLRLPENAIDTSGLPAKRIIGGVVPHHLLASESLAEFFLILADRPKQPKTIVLLSPNHAEAGAANVQTVEFLWDTPYGEVSTDSTMLQSLINATDVKPAPESFKNEHGIYSVLPYIAHFLPSTQVVPIILRYDTSPAEIAHLVEFLAPLVGDGEVMVVGSVDFSHYLSKTDADKKDTETLEAMQNFDLSQIAHFQSDHLDSPAAILILLQLARATNTQNIRVLRHDNSADGTRGNYDSTTGHFSLLFTSTGE